MDTELSGCNKRLCIWHSSSN